jgi:homoserine kinase
LSQPLQLAPLAKNAKPQTLCVRINPDTFSAIAMSKFPSVSVQVPATTANLGPGFDCLGAALALYNQFQFTALSPVGADLPSILKIEVEGVEAERVQRDDRNLAYKAFCYFFRQRHQPVPAVSINIKLGVPLSRGLGSSATAIVGGLLGANALAGSPLSQSELLDFAIALEGHPDNVAPALLGGCQLSARDQTTQTWTTCPIHWAPEIVPILAIPDFELSTQAARSVLPQQCSYADAIFNLSHLGLLIKGLETARGEWIQAALQDRLHQPYRIALIPGFAEVYDAAMGAGAKGLVISGAGPTLLALTLAETASRVAQQIQTTWQQGGMAVQVSIAQIDPHGATVQPIFE